MYDTCGMKISEIKRCYKILLKNTACLIRKLIQFYMKGGQYAAAAFENMMENDEMMSAVMLNYIAHNQEV